MGQSYAYIGPAMGDIHLLKHVSVFASILFLLFVNLISYLYPSLSRWNRPRGNISLRLICLDLLLLVLVLFLPATPDTTFVTVSVCICCVCYRFLASAGHGLQCALLRQWSFVVS